MTDLFREDAVTPPHPGPQMKSASPRETHTSERGLNDRAAKAPQEVHVSRRVVEQIEPRVASDTPVDAPAPRGSITQQSVRDRQPVPDRGESVRLATERVVAPVRLPETGLDALTGLSVTPVRRGFGAAKKEARRQELMQLSTPWPRMRAAMVLGDKGEAGKTPLSLGLAGAFGDVRGGGVGYVELNPTGNSARRLEPTGVGTLHSMVEDLSTLLRPDTAWTEVQQYLRYQGQGQFFGLPARLSRVTEDGTRLVPPTLERRQVDAALATLARFWSVAVLDGGNNFNDDPSQAGLAIADALLLPVRLDQQTCESAGRILDALASTGYAHLAEQAIIVVSQAPDDPHGKQAKEYRDFFAAQGLTVMDVPTDPHIHQRGVMRWDLLRAKTRHAYTQVALEVARRFSEAS